ncbi:MAG: hypothetical protein ACRENG_38430, partial [bacterium]
MDEDCKKRDKKRKLAAWPRSSVLFDMESLNKFLCVFFFIIFISTILPRLVSAQILRKTSVSASLGGGVVIPRAELKSGSFEWLLFTSNPKGYVLSKPGYMIDGKIKFGFPTLPVTLVGLISYSALSTDTTIIVFSP